MVTLLLMAWKVLGNGVVTCSCCIFGLCALWSWPLSTCFQAGLVTFFFQTECDLYASWVLEWWRCIRLRRPLLLLCNNSNHRRGHLDLLHGVLQKLTTTLRALLGLARPRTHSWISVNDCFGGHPETHRHDSFPARPHGNQVFQGCSGGSSTILQGLHGMLSATFTWRVRDKWRWTWCSHVVSSPYYITSGLQMLCMFPRICSCSWHAFWSSMYLCSSLWTGLGLAESAFIGGNWALWLLMPFFMSFLGTVRYIELLLLLLPKHVFQLPVSQTIWMQRF